ncbi:protein FAR1-RELATED SEQUENCE 4-like [Prunus persica]|uniref:protein FAR1-RELATED SEQUENCE 4-like n=1 Tax=Prunus persica TaxID=3760 RepID=UPI0009ABA573|nr:protein FAR1-RELATED SEQUENCE 4-like [Prunus persica]
MECEGQVTPEVRSELKPKLGLEFDCCDDVFNFYNMYAAEAGFSIRCSTTRTCTLTGELSLLEVQVGGLENVGFVKRDVYNYLRDVRGEVIGHDAELLKEHFMAMQEKNESFYFKMEVDSKGRMDSFVWLLEEFKKAMPGEQPKMIITDQDAAMSKAIAVTLSTTFHRYCIWHIFNKIIEKPGIGECFSEMCKCIWGMDKKEEFDAKGEEIITNYGLQDHT